VNERRRLMGACFLRFFRASIPSLDNNAAYLAFCSSFLCFSSSSYFFRLASLIFALSFSKSLSIYFGSLASMLFLPKLRLECIVL